MYCDRCGTKIEERQNFCPKCGRSMAIAPLMPVQSRLAGHVRLVAILWLAMSAFRLIPGLVMIAMFGQRGFPPGAPPFVTVMLHGIGVGLITFAAIGCVIGWGLLERRSWARSLAIPLACFGLIDIPFGTALGIYSLWVLLPAESEQEYRKIAQAA